MGFWGNVCAYALALLSHSPLSTVFEQEVTSSSPYFTHELSGSHSVDVFDFDPTAFPNTKPVPNAYKSEFTTANNCNGPESRDKWCGNTDINTDYEEVSLVPNTGITNKVILEITNGNEFCGDGYCRPTMLINGTYPGPLIRGNWGDWFEITVNNKLTNCNGTSFHWHGIRQFNSVWEDGVAGVTQCPIAPGKSQTYRWRATQYGTSWYHSHFSLQYADGIAGPLIIDGPTSKNYTDDKGPLMLTDWYHGESAFGEYHNEVMAQPPDSFLFPPSNLINGQGTFFNASAGDGKTYSPFGCTETNNTHCQPKKASIFRTDIEPSSDKNNRKVFKYRIINMSTTKHYAFWIDGHEFWVVATDFVPIKPVKMRYLNVAIGQRYDILIEAHTQNKIDKEFKGNPNFWIRTRLCDSYCVGDPCTAKECRFEECRQAILSYDETSKQSPDSNKRFADAPSARCIDPPSDKISPVVARYLFDDKVQDSMSFDDPFEVDRRAGTQNFTEVFGEEYGHRKQLEERGLKKGVQNGKGDPRTGPLPPAPDPNDKFKPHLWDFGSSKRGAMNPNGTYVSFMIDWANATLGLAAQGIPANTWNPRFVPVVLNDSEAGDWAIFAITANWRPEENHGATPEHAVPGAAHPIHLHGHDFVLLASGTEAFVYNKPYKLNLKNPPRRDVVLLPAYGYVIVAFKIDNPGTWLMHCHIAWHASSGLALEWVEMPDKIQTLMNKPELKAEFEQRCKDWREHEDQRCEYKEGYIAEQDDSGI